MKLDLKVLKDNYAIYKLEKDDKLPDWIFSSVFYSVTSTSDELSVVAVQNINITNYISCSSDWKIIKIEGLLDFSLIGIISEITAVLKNNLIPVFTVSTYNTDYFLVKQPDLDSALEGLRKKGHIISFEK